jgi:hypothetical protein
MAFVDEVSEAAIRSCRLNIGAFYGPPGADVTPGAGLVFAAVEFPIFNNLVGRFQARVGPVLILTHECDIDLENERAFNRGIGCSTNVDGNIFSGV